MSVELGLSAEDVEERYKEVRGRYPKLPEKLRPFQVSVEINSTVHYCTVGVGNSAFFKSNLKSNQLNIWSNYQIIKSSSLPTMGCMLF